LCMKTLTASSNRTSGGRTPTDSIETMVVKGQHS
jgi:hypothetical protein